MAAAFTEPPVVSCEHRARLDRPGASFVRRRAGCAFGRALLGFGPISGASTDSLLSPLLARAGRRTHQLDTESVPQHESILSSEFLLADPAYRFNCGHLAFSSAYLDRTRSC